APPTTASLRRWRRGGRRGRRRWGRGRRGRPRFRWWSRWHGRVNVGRRGRVVLDRRRTRRLRFLLDRLGERIVLALREQLGDGDRRRVGELQHLHVRGIE